MTSAENAGRISRTPGRLAAIFLAAITAGLILAAGSQPADSAVRAKVTVSPQGAKPGSVVSTAGSGFPERARGNVVFGGRTVARFTTSAKGKFAKRWAVPEGAKSGRVEVEAGSREAGTWLRVAEPLEGKRWSNPATWGGTATTPSSPSPPPWTARASRRPSRASASS